MEKTCRIKGNREEEEEEVKQDLNLEKGVKGKLVLYNFQSQQQVIIESLNYDLEETEIDYYPKLPKKFVPKTLLYNIHLKDGHFFVKSNEEVTFFSLTKNNPEKYQLGKQFLIGDKTILRYLGDNLELFSLIRLSLKDPKDEYVSYDAERFVLGRLHHLKIVTKTKKLFTIGSKDDCDIIIGGLKDYHCKFYKKESDWFLEKGDDSELRIESENGGELEKGMIFGYYSLVMDTKDARRNFQGRFIVESC